MAAAESGPAEFLTDLSHSTARVGLGNEFVVIAKFSLRSAEAHHRWSHQGFFLANQRQIFVIPPSPRPPVWTRTSAPATDYRLLVGQCDGVRLHQHVASVRFIDDRVVNLRLSSSDRCPGGSSTQILDSPLFFFAAMPRRRRRRASSGVGDFIHRMPWTSVPFINTSSRSPMWWAPFPARRGIARRGANLPARWPLWNKRAAVGPDCCLRSCVAATP